MCAGVYRHCRLYPPGSEIDGAGYKFGPVFITHLQIYSSIWRKNGVALIVSASETLFGVHLQINGMSRIFGACQLLFDIVPSAHQVLFADFWYDLVVLWRRKSLSSSTQSKQRKSDFRLSFEQYMLQIVFCISKHMIDGETKKCKNLI